MSNYCTLLTYRYCRESGDERGEGLAVSGLGEVHYTMGEYSTALTLHQTHLSIATRLGDRSAQVRACANLGTTFEALKDYEKAKSYQEQNLSIATLVNDRVAKIKALGNLGRLNRKRDSDSEKG